MKVFYIPGERFAHDEVIERDGVEVGRWGGLTIAQEQQKHPKMVCLEREECVKQIMDLAISPAQEITEDLFLEMRNYLPPVEWVRSVECETFHVAEFDVFDVTGIYVRIGARYFKLKDSYKLSHEERIAKVREVFPDA